jgi:hypothetical protein
MHDAHQVNDARCAFRCIYTAPAGSNLPRGLIAGYADKIGERMRNLTRVTLVVLALGLVGFSGYLFGFRQSGKIETAGAAVAQDNEELRRVYGEDQRDRSDPDPKGNVNWWAAVAPRDRARRERVKVLFAEGRLITAQDYYRAAMILQHGEVPEDFLLAHEFAVAAIVKGNGAAAWLAAATEDRFLTNIGRPQRFGTQFKADNDGPWRLEPVDPTMTDELRRVMRAPPLAEARARVTELNATR